MINSGKCPKCEKIIYNVQIEDIKIDVGYQTMWKGLSYLCPFCNTVLSVGFDQIALKADIINGILKKVKS